VAVILKDDLSTRGRAPVSSVPYASAGRSGRPARPLADRVAEAKRLGWREGLAERPALFGSPSADVLAGFQQGYQQGAATLQRTKSILARIRGAVASASAQQVSPEVQVAYDCGVRAAQCGLAPEPIYSRFARDQIREAYNRGFSAARTAMRKRG
jgi:hypothetical protein